MEKMAAGEGRNVEHVALEDDRTEELAAVNPRKRGRDVPQPEGFVKSGMLSLRQRKSAQTAK